MSGYHPSTVSLALRDDPRIQPETQQRVKAAAEKLGYRVHPMIAAWVSAPGRPAGRAPRGGGVSHLSARRFPLEDGPVFPEHL